MNNPIRFILWSVPALIGGLISAAQASNEDYGYWGSYHIVAPVTSKVDITLHPELRLDQDFDRFHYFYLQSGAVWHVHPNLDLAMNLAFIRTKNSRDVFTTEYREQPEIIPKWKLAGFPMVWRNRFEFRHRNHASDRYRTRLTVSAPRAYTPIKITPFISEEFFYDWGLGKYNQNRVTAGIRLPIDTRTQLSLFYLRRSFHSTRGTWQHINVAGTEIRILFGSPKG